MATKHISTSEEITESVDRTLLNEARKNELTVAYVRVVTLLMVTFVDWVAFGFPQIGLPVEYQSVSIPLLSSIWFLVAFGIVLVLRRGRFLPAMRFWLPPMDGIFIFLLFGNFFRTVGPIQFVNLGQLTACGVTCALYAASGSLRLTRVSVFLTTGLALAIYATMSFLAISWSSQVVLGLVVLLGTGLLSVRMTQVVTRAVESEIGRNTLVRFLPEHVVSRAHSDPLDLITVPRSALATILVSDIRRFTAMSEDLDPVVVLDLLNEVQGAFAQVVRKHGGIVDKFMGDGMLAVFLSVDLDRSADQSITNTDHASRAIQTSRSMIEQLKSINETWTKRGLKPIRVGVGIHSGNVVTGCLGSGARLEFTVIGDTVNTASRLESLTKEKKVDVLVSAETVHLAGDSNEQFREVGEVSIRGRVEPLVVYSM